MKLWSIEIFLMDEAGNQIEANIFSKATYNLHSSFANPIQSEHPVMKFANKELICMLQLWTSRRFVAKTRAGESLI
jgi:hypothetical protein